MNYNLLIVLTKPFNPDAGGVQRSTYKISKYFSDKGYNTFVFSFAVDGHKEQNVAKHYHSKIKGGCNIRENNELLINIIKKIEPHFVINQMPYERQITKTLLSARSLRSFVMLSCLRNSLFVVKRNIDSYIASLTPKKIQPYLKNNAVRLLFSRYHKMKHSRDLKYILDSYQYFIVFGPPNIEELKFFVGDYKLNKVKCIPNSILTVQDSVPKKEKRILWLSRVTFKQKRADLILPFWKKVSEYLPEWELDIVGDGDAFQILKSQIDRENIARVNMHGNQVPYGYYAKAPIYIMTSAYEGFPNTLIEAQSFGCVSVLYDSYPVCSWLLGGGESGISLIPIP